MAELVGQVEGAVSFTPTEIAGFPKVQWHVGADSPPDSLGVDGDLYLDSVTGDVYQKENHTWA